MKCRAHDGAVGIVTLMLATMLWCALWSGAAPPARAQTQFEAAAIVNDRIVTVYDVQQRARLLVANGAPADRAGAIALEQLVNDNIRLGAAEDAGLRLTETSTDGLLADYASQRGLSLEQLRTALARGGVGEAALREALSAEALWAELIRQRFGPRAEPTEAEIDQELSIASSGGSRSLLLQEIAIPFAGRDTAPTLARAEALAADLRAGADFAEAARRNSASPTASRGGDIGWLPEASLPLELADALSGVAPGAVVGPVPIQGGVAILRLNDVRQAEPVEGAQETLELALVQAAGRGAVDRVRAITDQNPDCVGALALASETGLQARRSDPTSFGALQPLTQRAVQGLAPGQNSGPVEAPGGAAVAFFVCSRVSGASPEARDAVRQRIRAERLSGFSSGYLQELRGDAVIDIR